MLHGERVAMWCVVGSYTNTENCVALRHMHTHTRAHTHTHTHFE